jgi:hypothetical protein
MYIASIKINDGLVSAIKEYDWKYANIRDAKCDQNIGNYEVEVADGKVCFKLKPLKTIFSKCRNQ